MPAVRRFRVIAKSRLQIRNPKIWDQYVKEIVDRFDDGASNFGIGICYAINEPTDCIDDQHCDRSKDQSIEIALDGRSACVIALTEQYDQQQAYTNDADLHVKSTSHGLPSLLAQNSKYDLS